MIKTIPVVSGRVWHINGAKYMWQKHDYCEENQLEIGEQVKVAEVIGSIQLDDLKKLVKAMEKSDHPEHCSIKYNLRHDHKCDCYKSAAETFREKYAAILKEGEMTIWFYVSGMKNDWLDQIVLYDGKNVYWSEEMQASDGYEFATMTIDDGSGWFVYVGEL